MWNVVRLNSCVVEVTSEFEIHRSNNTEKKH